MIDERKLIGELDAWWETLSPGTDARDSIICDAIEAVKEKIDNAEKVGEWIPVSERLPALGTWNIVTIKDHLRNGRRALRYPVIYMEKMYDTGYGFYENGTDILLPEYSEIIAWQPLPEPYREESAE